MLEKNKEIIGIARPQISASGQFQYLFIIPKQRADAGAFNFASSLSFFKVDTTNGKTTQRIPTTTTPTNNQEMEFQLTSNTQLTIKVKGTDGVVRSADITLT